MDENLDKVRFMHIKRVIEQVEKTYNGNTDELELSFEFVIASLFPQVYKNIQERLNKEHTMGYIEGYKAASAAMRIEDECGTTNN